MSNENMMVTDRVIYSFWDFQQALSALIFLLEECDYHGSYSPIQLRKLRCYESTLVVSFSRPFKVGRGREKLDLSVFSISLTSDELALKDKLIRLRDKVVSHSDEEMMLYKSYSIEPFDDCEIRMPMMHFNEALYLDKAEIFLVEKMLRKILCGMRKAIFKIAQLNPELLDKTKNTPV